MKKFIYLLSLILFMGACCTVQAQEAKQPVEVVDTSSLTFTEVYRDVRDGGGTLYTDIKSVVQDLSQSLKVGAEHVYEVLIMQQYVKAVMGLGVLIMTILCVFFMVRLWLEKYGAVDDCGDITAQGVFAIALSVLSIILVIAFFAGGFYMDIIQGFVNPEYGAIKDILDLVNGVK